MANRAVATPSKRESKTTGLGCCMLGPSAGWAPWLGVVASSCPSTLSPLIVPRLSMVCCVSSAAI
eukprot:9418105-Prorocentrum_lima.AAC.1